jgi:OOP family OmpA-OmpF porin
VKRLALIAAALAVLPSRARADGFQLERYEPTPAGSWFLGVPQPWYSSTRYFAGGLTLDYGHNPLLGGYYTPSFTETVAVVRHQLVGHLDVAGSFLDRVLVSASLPVTLVERGTAAFGAAPIGGGSVGDPRLGVMVRIWGQPDRSPISLHAGGYLWIPVGVAGSHAGDQNARGLPQIVASGMLKKHLRWAVDLGFLIRAQQTLGFGPANTAASEWRLDGAIAWADTARRWHVGPEIAFATDIAGPRALKKYGTSLELMLGGQYRVARMIQIGAGIGSGVVSVLGTPDVRVVLRVAYAPEPKPPKPAPPPPAPPLDSDHDGVPDAQDACPTVPGTARGCPDADRDGIPDGEDLCPNAKPGEIPDPEKKGCPKDSDADGVPDAEDLCPTAPPGTKPDPNQQGCPLDEDKDGVPDAEDLCPGVAPGAHPDPNRPGCPLPDADNDGVPDAEDACPKDAGEANADPKSNGCPKLSLSKGVVLQLRSVHFETNKWDLLPESFPILDEVARMLEEHKELTDVVIEGHADDRGTAAWNLRLSKHRAQSVMEYLIKKGIKRGRLSYVGFGDTKPLNPERTDEARAQNRRVEVRIPAKK